MTVEYGGFSSNFKREGWTFKGVARVCGMVALSLPMLPVQAVLVRLPGPIWWPVAGLWHRSMARLLGLQIEIVGARHKKGATLYAANHISWKDIVVLGGRLKGASFIAKSEVAGWGFLGTLCGLHKTIFVNRSRRTDSVNQRDALTDRIRMGHNLILFPEGTNTHGMHVNDFKSSLFSVAEQVHADGAPLTVQPVTLSYAEMDGIPLTRSAKARIAWLGDVELFDHLRQILAGGSILVTIEFHEPVTLDALPNRKELARYCENKVREGLERAHLSHRRLGARPVRTLTPPSDQISSDN